MRIPSIHTLRMFLVAIAPLLLGVSCMETTTAPFEDARGVLRGTWTGRIGSSDTDALEFRFEGLEASRSGPDTYRFEGQARFGLETRPGRVTGTGTVDPPFGPASSGRMARQMTPPPLPIYTFEATVTGPDGEARWRMEGSSDGGSVGQAGTARSGDGIERPVRVSRSPGPHVIGLRVHPVPLAWGEAFEVTWSGWAPEDADVTCELFVLDGERVAAPACTDGIRSATLRLPTIDPSPTDYVVPEVDVVLELAWGEGSGRSYELTVPVTRPAP